MNFYLYVNDETGEKFFVQAKNMITAERILRINEFNLSDLRFLGRYCEQRAMTLGYDVY